MGFRVALISVFGKDPRDIQRELALLPTDNYEEFPESPVAGMLLPTGGYLLYLNDQIIPNQTVLGRLSKSGSLMICQVNETVMNSYASGWVDGVEEWSVNHDAQYGIQHLETTGKPPSQLPAIHADMLVKQQSTEDVDYIFDVPVELYVANGGVRYSEDVPGTSGTPWQVLSRVKPRKRSWWRVW